MERKELILLVMGVIAGGTINYIFYTLSNQRLTKLYKLILDCLEGVHQNNLSKKGVKHYGLNSIYYRLLTKQLSPLFYNSGHFIQGMNISQGTRFNNICG